VAHPAGSRYQASAISLLDAEYEMRYLFLSEMAKENKPPSMSINLSAPGAGIGRVLPARKPELISVRLEGMEGLDHLTSNSQKHLEGRIQDFAVQVIAEARAIEQREHAGKGPPEVTAAHIAEAWWVIRRRIRHARHPILLVVARALETFGVAGIGVGATVFLSVGVTDFQKKWSPIVFIASCLVTMGAFLLEVYTARRD
jgi:hypothetical protein